MIKQHFSLQVPDLECFQVNLNCLNPDSICFEKKCRTFVLNDEALKEVFPYNIEGRRREGISCNMAVSGHPLPHAETPSSLHFSSPHPAPSSPSPL